MTAVIEGRWKVSYSVKCHGLMTIQGNLTGSLLSSENIHKCHSKLMCLYKCEMSSRNEIMY